MIEWLDKHLIDDWRDSWRFMSVQFAGVVGATVVAYPDLILQLIMLLSSDRKIQAAAIIGTLVVILIRLWGQGDKEEEDGEEA